MLNFYNCNGSPKDRKLETKNSHRLSHNLTSTKNNSYQYSREKNNNSTFETVDRYKNINNMNLQDYLTLPTHENKRVTPYL